MHVNMIPMVNAIDILATTPNINMAIPRIIMAKHIMMRVKSIVFILLILIYWRQKIKFYIV